MRSYNELRKNIVDANTLIDYLCETGSDWQGKLDYNDAKEIAGFAREWELKEIPLNLFADLLGDPEIINKNPIVTFGPEMNWEIADGKHRVGSAKARGEKTIMAYVAMSR